VTQSNSNDLPTFYLGLAGLQAARGAMFASHAKIRLIDSEQHNAIP
jgi:hypothetical protein